MNPKDPQQFILYRVEREEIGCRDYARLTLEKAKQISRSVCRTYGMPQAKLRRRVMGRWAAEWDDGTIWLNPKKGTASDLLTLLHELAHHLHYHLWDGFAKQEDHGPEFMACYMSIMDTVRLIPYDAMGLICRRRGLRYFSPGPSLKSLRRAVRQK